MLFTLAFYMKLTNIEYVYIYRTIHPAKLIEFDHNIKIFSTLRGMDNE